MTTYPLSVPQAVAVADVLSRSALALCPGVDGRVMLGDGVLMVSPHGWSWSSGELVLLAVLVHICGDGPLPDLARLDEPNREVVREALAGLVAA